MPTESRPVTPLQDPEQVQALRESNQSTRPNKGSSASSQLLSKVKKETVKPGISVDMAQRKYCNSKDMIMFLLALCCRDDSSATPAPRDKVLEDRFDECHRSVIPIANNPTLRNQLEDYQSSSATHEWNMYIPFAAAMNHALERLSEIEVGGLPEFKDHIAFVPCDRNVQSDRSIPGSLFKPDIAVMSIQDACDFHGLDKTKPPNLSGFTTKIKHKLPSGLASWKSVLAAVELKRTRGSWPELKDSNLEGQQPIIVLGADKWLDEKTDDSQPATPMSSSTLVSSKRSASAAKLDASTGTSGIKRQRMMKEPTKKARHPLAIQTGIYAAEKFSDSFSVSHVLNLLIRNDCLWVSWVDREGAIFSSAFSFFENLPLLLILLLVLQRFGHSQWGYISELATHNDTGLLRPIDANATLGESGTVLLHPIDVNATLGETDAAITFYPNDTVHSSWTLLGRATTIVGASRNKEGDSIVKGERSTEPAHGGVDSTGVHRGQNSEEACNESGSLDGNRYDIVRGTTIDPTTIADKKLRQVWEDFYQARDDYRKAHAKMIKSHDLVLKVSWPETSRVKEWEVVKHAQTLGEHDKYIKGHIPEVKYARDFDRCSTCHIRRFLDLQQDGRSGTRILRLIVMKRLWPIYDLDGEQFWSVIWQCVACHYRLWIHGIHHGDISLHNLMYDILAETGDPVGIVNDFDLATWADHPTTNSDRTGTIPFMAIDLLDGGLDHRDPRLYRHDLESFTWVLAYVTVANIGYKGCAITISPRPGVDAWFKDRTTEDRAAHITSKTIFHSRYGRKQVVFPRYRRYFNTIREITKYWFDFHESRVPTLQLLEPTIESTLEGLDLSEPEVDDPAGLLQSFIQVVEKSLGETDALEGFAEVKVLLGAIRTPIATKVDSV